MEPHKNLIYFFEAAHDDTPKAYFTIFVAATILITAKDILCLLGVLIKDSFDKDVLLVSQSGM